MVGLFLLVSGYFVWILLFVVLAWRGRLQRLTMPGTVMMLAFAACYVLISNGLVVPSDPASGAVLISLAYAICPGPLVIAAVVYPIGRCWAWYRTSSSVTAG